VPVDDPASPGQDRPDAERDQGTRRRLRHWHALRGRVDDINANRRSWQLRQELADAEGRRDDGN
jgi:hypothetical protein